MKKKCLCGMAVGLILLAGCGQTAQESWDYEEIVSEGEEGVEDPGTDNINDSEMENDIEELWDTGTEDDLAEENLPDMQTDDGFQFSTEYDVEDYCQGCFIVSKNDGLLYGMLDRNGNEILPVEYDEIVFMNKEEVCNGKHLNLYIRTKYEDESTVVNSVGQQILDKPVSCVEYKLGVAGPDSAFFEEVNEAEGFIKFYKEDGTLLSELTCGEELRNNGSEIAEGGLKAEWVAEDLYLLSQMGLRPKSNRGFTSNIYYALYNKDNQIVKDWGEVDGLGTGYVVDDKYTFFVYVKDNGVYKYTIDESGSLKEEGETSEEEILKMRQGETGITGKEFHLGENNDMKLYCSNDTWKLVDAAGNPLYDERYYECIKKSNCYFLANENNELCLIDKNGDMLIEYGWLTKEGDDVYFNGAVLSYDNFLVGDDGVCIALGSDIYFFSAEK